MALYKFADRVFELKNKYKYTDRICADYAIDEAAPDYVIEVTADEIMKERVDDSSAFPPPYLESLAIYRKIAECLAEEDCFLMHAAVIEYRGKAYAFTARSGTGKTTHVSLWEKAFGEDVRIINGDKPLVRRIIKDGKSEFTVYGTPWCGKERKHINASAPLAGFCLLERSAENFITPAGEEAVPFLLGQMLLKKNIRYMGALMAFADALVTSVPIYRLGVNTDISAAEVARNGLCGK